jgi:hypothetical protein
MIATINVYDWHLVEIVEQPTLIGAFFHSLNAFLLFDLFKRTIETSSKERLRPVQ